MGGTAKILFVLLAFSALASCSLLRRSPPPARTSPQAALLPAMRWDGQPEAYEWTTATLDAVRGQGAVLLASQPTDVAAWCPAYAKAGKEQRAAFWAGVISAIARHESRFDPMASGGGGRWIGLMQISPHTAQAFGCAATDAHDLENGPANLRCAVRIAAAQVNRDQAIVSRAGAWRGLARDWAPLRDPAKLAQMADWVSRQSYCRG